MWGRNKEIFKINYSALVSNPFYYACMHAAYISGFNTFSPIGCMIGVYNLYLSDLLDRMAVVRTDEGQAGSQQCVCCAVTFCQSRIWTGNETSCQHKTFFYLKQKVVVLSFLFHVQRQTRLSYFNTKVRHHFPPFCCCYPASGTWSRCLTLPNDRIGPDG